MDQVFDVAIIGGGINGCGCAADAALRGLSVILFEQDDLASKTSSSSTKLIHGGLRYLEYYEFSLVKKALEERQTLLHLAPHLVHPQSFILPCQSGMRPAWLLRLGLFVYDHLSSKNQLPKCNSVSRKANNTYFKPLNQQFKRGFLFYDAATDDARLTISNALQAREHGASIRPHSCVTHAEVRNNKWLLTIQPKDAPSYKVYARCLINAAGPWVESVATLTKTPVQKKMKLVKGSHFLVSPLYEGNHAYFLQHSDQRIIFIIPYHNFHMIGTTEIEHDGPVNQIQISDEEIKYLTEIVNAYLKTNISKKDIIYSWSGIRPLIAHEDTDMKALSRDYHYEFSNQLAPIITIFGGKLTTYRQLSEEIINQLAPLFPQIKASKTKTTPLPGATGESMSFEDYLIYAQKKYHWLDAGLLNRYLYSYGTRTEQFLSGCTSIESMGKKYGPALYQIEVDYLIAEEWAKDCDDILERRTKLGLSMDSASKNELKEYLATLAPCHLPAETEFH